MTDSTKYEELPVAEAVGDAYSMATDRDEGAVKSDDTAIAAAAADDDDDDAQPPPAKQQKKPRKSAWEDSGGNRRYNGENFCVYACTNLCGICLAYACCELCAKVY
jgi:hypothetical protein